MLPESSESEASKSVLDTVSLDIKNNPKTKHVCVYILKKVQRKTAAIQRPEEITYSFAEAHKRAEN